MMHAFQVRDHERSPTVQAQGRVVIGVFLILLFLSSAACWVFVAMDARRILRERRAERGAAAAPEQRDGLGDMDDQSYVSAPPNPVSYYPRSPTTYRSSVSVR
ncbi:hypothetical protein F5Y05DRAFT_413676 [Hypoxylon sp. FL0543]|nr:hypothetical protein F5Y05DRAFT_413676 [Hypoxylon sp. FL0543]